MFAGARMQAYRPLLVGVPAAYSLARFRMRGNTAWFGRDYARAMSGVDVPNLAHELGHHFVR